MAKKLIEIKGLNLTYNLGASNAFRALHDVSVDIDEGDFAIILGPSGCGKSSLLNIIAGLELPETGTVLVQERDLLNLTEKERVEYHRKEIGKIFQAYNLISTLNVLDNVALPQIFIGKRKKDRNKKAMEILERLGIGEHAKKIPSELSGGQQQRIGIARSIINDPQFILADEPVGNLDSVSSNNVMEILTKLNNDEGKTVIMVTHNPEHASWGNRIIHMRDGKITKVEIKNKDGIIQRDNREEVLSGFDNFVNRFRGLSKSQIKILLEPLKAQYLSRGVTTVFNKKQLESMEGIIKNRISNKINKEKLCFEFDKSENKGGVGLDSRTARKISNKIERIFSLAVNFAGTKETHKKALLIITGFLELNDYAVNAESQQKLLEFLTMRLNKKTNNKQLIYSLGLSVSKKGAGLDPRLVDKLVDFVDLVQVVGFSLEDE